MSTAGRLINWPAKPFIKFNKALFRGSGELVLVTRAAAAIPANHIIIMRLYYGSVTPPLPPTHPTTSPPSVLFSLSFLWHSAMSSLHRIFFFPMGIWGFFCLNAMAGLDRVGLFLI